MARMLRVAIGSVQPGAETQFVCWALLRALCAAGMATQHFLARACFTPYDGASPATGRPTRHLDSWTMTRETCQQVLRRGAVSEFSLVEGRFPAADGVARLPGGDLETLCKWLDLPRLVVLDVSRLSPCSLPDLPANVAGVFLDGVRNAGEFRHWQTVLEPLWQVPIVGGLGVASEVRAAIGQLPRGESVPSEICTELARQLSPYTSLDRICQIADRPAIEVAEATWFAGDRGFQPRVAMAFDPAFRCYFPDTLEELERCGAKLLTFSPLRDGGLPPQTDIVYLGCGHPERHAAALAANHCMLLAVREHVCSGRRVYAEGGGLAYLCEAIQSIDGRRENMVGIFPAVAHVQPHPAPARAVELVLRASTWLAPRGTRLRGYLNSNWRLEPASSWSSSVVDLAADDVLFTRRSAVGSLAHLNFASCGHCLHSFLRPHTAGRQLVEV